jgi:NAD(P)H-dependent flavin oxidoreductase YrpB (nitropropane dioxygenase family)
MHKLCGFAPLDEVNFEKMQKVGLPFWLAGGRATPEALQEAFDLGAEGVQVGSLFALSKDSGLLPKYREQMLQAAREHNLKVRTDHRASPTGFPFKVVELEGTVGMKDTYQARPRLCDLGYLRSHTITTEGKTISKCAAEPDAPYLKKGGKEEDLDKRICLCNGLMASIGLGQERPDGYKEAPLLTLGATTEDIDKMLIKYPDGWTAKQVVDVLINKIYS